MTFLIEMWRKYFNVDIYKKLSRSRFKKSCVYFIWEKNKKSCDFAILEIYFRPCWSDSDNVTEAYISIYVHSAKHITKVSRRLFRLALQTIDYVTTLNYWIVKIQETQQIVEVFYRFANFVRGFKKYFS